MSDKHIISMIENVPLASLGESELATIHAHAAGCPECRQAFQAARISSLLLKERAAETFEPSPFFQTRVLAALRERQAEQEGSVFARLWKTAGGLVSSMAATVALLAVLTFALPQAQPATATDELATSIDPYSAEAVIFNQDAMLEDLSDGQVMTTLYATDEETIR